MSRALITEGYLTDIANAIRAKMGVQDTYTPPQMAAAIEALDTSGIHPTGTKNITQNGTHDVTQYASANVNVQPNLQSKTATQNGTVTPDQGYDGLSSVVVNVSGGGGGGSSMEVESFGYVGDREGGTGSMSTTIKSRNGKYALFVVMRRDVLTFSQSLELLDERPVVENLQSVALYKTQITNDNYSITITGNGRKSCVIWLFDKDFEVEYKAITTMSGNSDSKILLALNGPSLIVGHVVSSYGANYPKIYSSADLCVIDGAPGNTNNVVRLFSAIGINPLSQSSLGMRYFYSNGSVNTVTNAGAYTIYTYQLKESESA